MSTEHRDSIYRAENLRVAGQLEKALAEVYDARIDPTTIPSLSDNLLSDYIRKWRVWTVTGMSLAQKQWFAKDARDTLLAIKPIFTDYYNNSDVQRRSRNYLKDNEGHDYDHWAEMLRDKGKYWLVAYDISINSRFLDESIENFQTAYNHALLNSPKGIAQIELGKTIRMRLGLNHEATGLAYDMYVHEGYELAKPAVLASGDRDRLKWLLNTVGDEAALASFHSNIAKQDMKDVDNDFNLIFGKYEARKTRREHNLKQLAFIAHRITWNLTRTGVDFSQIPVNY